MSAAGCGLPLDAAWTLHWALRLQDCHLLLTRGPCRGVGLAKRPSWPAMAACTAASSTANTLDGRQSKTLTALNCLDRV